MKTLYYLCKLKVSKGMRLQIRCIYCKISEIEKDCFIVYINLKYMAAFILKLWANFFIQRLVKAYQLFSFKVDMFNCKFFQIKNSINVYINSKHMEGSAPKQCSVFFMLRLIKINFNFGKFYLNLFSEILHVAVPNLQLYLNCFW